MFWIIVLTITLVLEIALIALCVWGAWRLHTLTLKIESLQHIAVAILGVFRRDLRQGQLTAKQVLGFLYWSYKLIPMWLRGLLQGCKWALIRS